MKKFIAIALAAFALAGCAIPEDGTVGLRINMNNTVDKTELKAGTYNQVLIGTVLIAAIRQIAVEINDQQPVASDGSKMKDFDATVVYSINPEMASELFIDRSKDFNVTDADGRIYLQHKYMQATGINAIHKIAGAYSASDMNEHREEIERLMMGELRKTLAKEGLDKSIVITAVQVRSIKPPDSVTDAAARVVRANAELDIKNIEVDTAKKEAERIATLNANAGAVGYMNAQSLAKIADGVAEGKVHTIVVPYDFKGIVNVGSK